MFSSDAYVSIDYQKKHGMVARKTKNLGAIRDAVSKIRAGEIEDLSQLNFPDLVRVEELQFETTERFINCLAVYQIVAWRVLFALRLGREDTVLVVGSGLTAILALFIDWLAGIAEDILRPKGL